MMKRARHNRLSFLLLVGTLCLSFIDANNHIFTRLAPPIQTQLFSGSNYDDKKKNEIDLGTTLIAVCFKGGVVLGADSRTSVGQTYVSNRFADKVCCIMESALLGRSGSAADTQHLAQSCHFAFTSRQYRWGTTAAKPTLNQIAHYVKSLVLKEDVSASLLCAGLDNNRGKIYSIASSGALLDHDHDGYAVAGSGSTYILGHVDDMYRSDMSQDEAIEFVVRAIQLAIQRDGGSGGFVRVHVLTSVGYSVKTILPPLSSRGDDSKNNGAGTSSTEKYMSAAAANDEVLPDDEEDDEEIDLSKQI